MLLPGVNYEESRYGYNASNWEYGVELLMKGYAALINGEYHFVADVFNVVIIKKDTNFKENLQGNFGIKYDDWCAKFGDLFRVGCAGIIGGGGDPGGQ